MIRQTFISHNQADTPWCKQLRLDLIRRLRLGRHQELIYLDDNMALGLRWEDHLWDELKRSGCVLVIVSSHAAASSWVHAEVECAVQQQHADSSIAIIPLILDMTSPARVHPELAKYQYADFTHPIKYDESLRRLVYVLKHPDVLTRGGAVPLPRPPAAERAGKAVLRYLLGILTGGSL